MSRHKRHIKLLRRLVDMGWYVEAVWEPGGHGFALTGYYNWSGQRFRNHGLLSMVFRKRLECMTPPIRNTRSLRFAIRKQGAIYDWEVVTGWNGLRRFLRTPKKGGGR